MYKKNQLYRFTVGAMFIIGGLLIGLSLFFLLYPSSEQSEREVPSKRKSTMDLKTGDRFPSSTPISCLRRGKHFSRREIE